MILRHLWGGTSLIRRCGCTLVYNKKYSRWQYLRCCIKHTIRMIRSGKKA